MSADTSIPDFTPAELQVAESALESRFGGKVEIELADSELRLEPDVPALTSCPTLYWRAQDCHFVVFKTAANRYRCQFFYGDDEHFGTGRSEYGGLEECMAALLHAHADHELSLRK